MRMREYSRTEIIREKCHYCGCKNKLYTDLTYESKIVGKSLRCCNCGRVDTYIDPDTESLSIALINGKIKSGSQKCIQESFCPHRKCKLYGTCGGFKQPPDESGGDYDDKSDIVNNTEIELITPPKFK